MLKFLIKGILRVIFLLCLLELPFLNSIPDASAGEAGRTTFLVEKEGEGDESLFSMEFRDASLKDVLRALGQEKGLNIIIADGIDGKLTLSFHKVTLMDAFDSILKINSLTYYKEGDIIRIIKSAFPEGEETLLTKTIPINFANAKEMSDSLKGVLSKKGSINVDVRTNTLIVKDVPDNIERIIKLVKELDSQTPQVMIEARIVEASTSFTRELGVQWGGTYEINPGEGSLMLHGGAFKQKSTDTYAQALTGGLGLSGSPFAVNLPAAVGAGSGGALGLMFGNVSNTVFLDLQLSAMEDAGKGKILSNPKVLTLNNKEAKISSGTEILIPTASITTTVSATTVSPQSTTTGVTTIEAKLELTVTPHITPDNKIIMHIKTDKKEPDYSRQVQNIPPLTTRTAETDLLVKDGDTIVIGGIYTRNESKDESGVPWLMRIPVIGWLFKKQTKVDSQTELLIFITPTVYKRE